MSRRVKVSKLKEAIRHLVLQELNEQENDKPDHFGGGENIDILGYKTKHFDICKSAVILYQKLMEKDLNDEAKELVVSSAKEMDHIFEMEKQVVNGEEVDHDPVEHGIELTNIISFQLGRVAEMIGEDFERDTNFIKMHVMEIVKRHKRDVDEASTTASAGAANPMGTGIYYDTPYAFRSKRKKDKEKLKKITRAGGYKPVNEIANQEISALQNVEKGLKKLQQDYIKITNIGDKTLRNRQYNDYYEYIIGAKEGIGKLIQTLKRKQTLGEGRYHQWRNDESLTPKQKIGKSMREIRDALNELDKTVKMNLKLKTELKMKSEDYWKNTHKALTKISERLVKMANKVGNLK
jgi:hypothetical protein